MLSTEWWADRESGKNEKGGVDEWVAEEQPKKGEERQEGKKLQSAENPRERERNSAIY